MSTKNDAFRALSCLQFAVDQRIVEDVTGKVTKMTNELQTELDTWRARALSQEMKSSRREAICAEALARSKQALDDLIATIYPEESGYFAVMGAYERTQSTGTIAYIAEVLQVIRTAQNALKE